MKKVESDFSQLAPHTMGWLRGRFVLGMMFFLVPAFICFFSML